MTQTNPYEKCIQSLENPTIEQLQLKISTCKNAQKYLKQLPGMDIISDSEYPAMRIVLGRIRQLHEKLEQLQRIPSCEQCKKHGALTPSNIHILKEAVYQCYECTKSQIYNASEKQSAEQTYKKLYQEVHQRVGKLKESVRHCFKCHKDSFLFLLDIIKTQCNVQSINNYKNHPLTVFKDSQTCLESMIYSCKLMEKYTKKGDTLLLSKMKTYLNDFLLISSAVPRTVSNYSDVYAKILTLTISAVRNLKT